MTIRKNSYSFGVEGQNFVLDSKPIQLISGAVHYFRIHPEYWVDRLSKMKACGLNCIEIYVPWNMHEPAPGEFNFAGFYDIERFITLAGEMGLYVLLRPGPFICAEFEGGGLPWWLHTIPDLEIRCANEPYLERCRLFYAEFLPRMKPLCCTHGGPIIAMQIENEYGSYGNDHRYLEELNALFHAFDPDLMRFTSDGPVGSLLSGGTLPEVFKTANFGSKPTESFKELRKVQAEGPMMCMEYWNGWFDHWGEPHLAQQRKLSEYADDVELMLAAGHSINFYMFHGGTNFGFTSGANFDNEIQPTITSYDYGAALSECGDMTEKYDAYKCSIAKHTGIQNQFAVSNTPKIAYPDVELNQRVSLFDTLDASQWIESAQPLSMEAMGQGYGFILYRTTLVTDGWETAPEIFIAGLHDRAHIFIDGAFKGIMERADSEAGRGINIGMIHAGQRLDILVENMGRINFGPQILDKKGILDCVRFENQKHYGWQMMSLPLDKVEALQYHATDVKPSTPAFHKGSFQVETRADTFIDMSGWKKGVLFINGFNLGRYWERGPQTTLFCPAPLLKKGKNDLVVFELEGNERNHISFRDVAELGN